MKIKLRQLSLVATIVRLGSLTAAAKYLGLSQSAASGALKELECQLGRPLFERVGKRLKPTDGLLKSVPQIYSLLDQAVELEGKLSAKSVVGDLRVGASLTLGNYVAVEMIARYMEQHEGAKARLEVANTQSVMSALVNLNIDVALVDGEIHHDQIEMIPFVQDRLVVFCSPANPLAKQYHIDFEQLVDSRWILREPGSGTRHTFERYLGEAFSELDIFMELEHTEAIKRAVEQDLGLGCLSDITLREAFKKGRLAPLEIDDQPWRRQTYIAVHKQRQRTASMDAWIELCKAQVEYL